MSKKPHHLAGLGSILDTLKAEAPPPSPALPSAPPAKPQPEAVKAGKGRPATGKKSNDEYCQTTISIRKETRKRVKQALLDAETGQDVSELVEELLSQWLASHT